MFDLFKDLRLVFGIIYSKSQKACAVAVYGTFTFMVLFLISLRMNRK